MKIQPQANNSITIILDNGDEFTIYTPNEKELVFSRTREDRRAFSISSFNTNGDWEHQCEGWMIRITKAIIKQKGVQTNEKLAT